MHGLLCARQNPKQTKWYPSLSLWIGDLYAHEQGTLLTHIEHAELHEDVLLHPATYSFRKVSHSVTMSQSSDLTANVDELRDLNLSDDE